MMLETLFGLFLAAATPQATTIAKDGKQPRVAVGADGSIAVVYGQGNEIFSRVSRDGGASYEPPTRVGQVEALMLGMRRGPQVAVSGSSIVVTAIGRNEGDVVAWRSGDAGRTWTSPKVVNDQPRSAREGLHALAAGGKGSLHVVWLDLRDGRTQIFASRSLDGGQSWQANRRVYASPDGSVCECCQPTVAADAAGEVAVMWRNSLAGARDMFVARSKDDGVTFGDAEKLGQGSWRLNACPMDGGGLAVNGGRIASVWRREEVVYTALPGQAEASLGPGRNATIALGPAGASLAWQSAAGEILLKRGDASANVIGRGKFPAFGSAPGAARRLVLAWEDPESGAVALVLSP